MFPISSFPRIKALSSLTLPPPLIFILLSSSSSCLIYCMYIVVSLFSLFLSFFLSFSPSTSNKLEYALLFCSFLLLPPLLIHLIFSNVVVQCSGWCNAMLQL